MYLDTVMRTFIAMLVSATMALPAPLWAQAPGSNDTNAEATDGIPVVLQPVTLNGGKTGYLVIAPYLAKDEAAVIKRFATTDPQHLVIGVAGPEDPALKFALETGNLAQITSYIVGDVDKVKATVKAPKSIREKLKDKVKAITELCKAKKVGLITSVVASGIVGSWVWVHTSSLGAGLAVWGSLFAWSGFQAVFSHHWERFLDKGGTIFKRFVSWALRREPTPDELRASESIGMFKATWAANSIVQGGVLAASGAFNGSIAEEGVMWAMLDAMGESMWYGVLSSTDLLDGAVSQKIKQGRFPASFFSTFVVMRMVGAACFEVAGYMHIPGVQFALASITSFTLIYMAFRKINEVVDSRYDMSREVVTRVLDTAREKIPCELRLAKPRNISIAQGEPAE